VRHEYKWVNNNQCDDEGQDGLGLLGTRSPAIAEGPRDAGVPVEIW